MGQLIHYADKVELTAIDCGFCGAVFAINERYRLQREQRGGSWHCPYCQTSLSYTESELKKTQKLLAEEKSKREFAQRNAEAERAAREKTEKQLRSAKKRAAAGVCPCCHRTVSQMARHIATKHPEFKP